MTPPPAGDADGPPRPTGGERAGGGARPGGSPNRNRSRNRNRNRGPARSGSGGGQARQGGRSGQGGGGGRQGQRSGASRTAAGRRPGPEGGRAAAVRTEEPGPAVTGVGVRAAGPGTVTDDEVRANVRRARWLCAAAAAVPAVVVGLVVLLLAGPIVGVVALVVVGAGLAVTWWRGAPGLARRALNARPQSGTEAPRLTNMVRGLCATMGLSEPEILVIDDDVPNACSVGAGRGGALVVVTTGLLARVDVLGLEGVLAHELAHVKRQDTTVAAVALAVLGPLCRATGDDRWMRRALGAAREYRADQIAVAAVRYPPGLRDALAAMEAAPDPAPGSLFAGRPAVAVRCLSVDPMVGRRRQTAAGDLNDTGVRIAALTEW